MARKIRFAGRQFHLPSSSALRIAIGLVLVIFGILGFLPILGFWMIPLGLLVLSIDIPIVRRWRRQLTVWWYRKRDERRERKRRAAEDAGLHLESGGAPRPDKKPAETH